jgi:hypothetical protein
MIRLTGLVGLVGIVLHSSRARGRDSHPPPSMHRGGCFLWPTSRQGDKPTSRQANKPMIWRPGLVGFVGIVLRLSCAGARDPHPPPSYTACCTACHSAARDTAHALQEAPCCFWSLLVSGRLFVTQLLSIVGCLVGVFGG